MEAEVSKGLIRVEEGLREAARAEEPLLAKASRHLIDAGGKRFRATLVLLAAQFGNPADERVVPAAVAIELTHLATLYHDDVMDEAPVRRGHESANSRWSNMIAILTGDFLFARASRILADLGDEAIRIQADTFSQLVSGQIAETIGPEDGADPLEHYLRVVRDKTASLIATAGRFGAMFSDAPAEVVRRITPACHALGVAFQLSDDILD
ncbi:MAG TPA: polyprenyl synthetase family protein, partial [Streptosporangiaceae bacterium]